MEKKNLSFLSYENERISIIIKKKQLALHKMCVTSLLCGQWADLWPFYGLYCKQFYSLYKVYQGWGLQRSGLTDPQKENGRKFTPTYCFNRLQIPPR